MREHIRHLHTSHELKLPLEDLQRGDEIMLSEMQSTAERPDKQFCTSQVTMVLEGVKEIYGRPALEVNAKSRVEGPAKEFPKGDPFLLPLNEDGAIPVENGLTIVTFEDHGLTPQKVGGDWTRVRVSRPEQRRHQTRRIGQRALIPSLFIGFRK